MKQHIRNRVLRIDPKDSIEKSYLEYVDCSIAIKRNGKIEITAHIIASNEIKRVNIIIQLQKLTSKWINIKIWSVFFNSHFGKMRERYTSDGNHKYRIVVDFYVYIDDYKDWAMMIVDE